METITTKNYEADNGDTLVIGGKLILKKDASIEGVSFDEAVSASVVRETLENSAVKIDGGYIVEGGESNGLNAIDISGIVQLRGGTQEVLASVNPLPAAREIMCEIDTGRMKIGDGTTRWNSLQYLGAEPEELRIVLTSEHITQKSVALPATCKKIISVAVNGLIADRDVDFGVSGNTITWQNFGFDGLLQAGDKLSILIGKDLIFYEN